VVGETSPVVATRSPVVLIGAPVVPAVLAGNPPVLATLVPVVSNGAPVDPGSKGFGAGSELQAAREAMIATEVENLRGACLVIRTGSDAEDKR